MILIHNKPVACYHWWSHPNEPPPYANLRTPILPSIATLRGVSDVDIIVLDLSERENDWAHFPDKLGFRVQRCGYALAKYKQIKNRQQLSRILDVHREVESAMLYVDSDVFFFRNPLPFACNPQRFCYNGCNTGVFYYNPSSEDNRLWYDIFECYIKTAIYSKGFRGLISDLEYEAWYDGWDELVVNYMNGQHPELFERIPVEEHIAARDLPNTVMDRAKMFHCNGTMVENPIAKYAGEMKHSRGVTCLAIKEFYDNARRALDQHDLDMIFTPREQDHYVSRQFSLIAEPERLYNTKDASGHFHLQKCLWKTF